MPTNQISNVNMFFFSTKKSKTHHPSDSHSCNTLFSSFNENNISFSFFVVSTNFQLNLYVESIWLLWWLAILHNDNYSLCYIGACVCSEIAIKHIPVVTELLHKSLEKQLSAVVCLLKTRASQNVEHCVNMWDMGQRIKINWSPNTIVYSEGVTSLKESNHTVMSTIST